MSSVAYFICPLCGEPIEAMMMSEVLSPAKVEGGLEDAVEALVARHVEANNAIVAAHFNLNHTLLEAMIALGEARNALLDIREIITDGFGQAVSVASVKDTVDRGLGGK